ncbi:MAG: DUF1987 domain-containing protein [Bacteroidales bacterium]
MTTLRIEPEDDSPMVNLSKEKGIFEISGKSMPEDVVFFYQPVLDWMDAYKADPLEKTVFDFKLIYFNTASSKLILDLLMLLEEIQEKGNEVLVRWYSLKTDEDMHEAGEEYADMTDLKFEYHTFEL